MKTMHCAKKLYIINIITQGK